MSYFTVEVKPTIAASKQHAAAFTAGDVLFDWASFEIPRGGANLIGVTALVRPKGDANPTPNNFAMSLIFGRDGTNLNADLSSTSSIGNPNDVAFLTGKLTNAILGSVEVDIADYVGPNTAVATSCLSVATTSPVGGVVLDSSYNTASSIGYDKYYIAGVANGAFDFRSINVINDADINSTTPTAIVMAGASMDVREHFAGGDVLHAEDDILLGTVASIDGATTGPINLTAATSGAGDATTVANGDTIYNINPIRLILHFEQNGTR